MMMVQNSYIGTFLASPHIQGRRQVCKSGGAGMLLSADILPQNTMYSNIRYNEPQKLGGLQPPSPPLVYTRENWVNSRKLNAVAHLAVVVVTKGGYNTPTVSFLVATV